MPDPSGSIDSFLDNLGVPIHIPADEFFFGVARLPAEQNVADQNAAKQSKNSKAGINGAPDSWELVFMVKTASPIQARSLFVLFSVARLFITKGAAPESTPEEKLLSLSPQDAAALLFARAPEQDGQVLTLRTDALDAGRIALLFNLFSIYSD